MSQTAEQTATIEGKTYRLAESTIPAEPKFDLLRAAFRAHGIADHLNARPPRSRNRFVQLFKMLDGSYQIARSSVVGEVCRASRAMGQAQAAAAGA